MTLLRLVSIVSAFLIFTFLTTIANAGEVVRVAGYAFPPFVSQNGKEGLTIEFLEFLNSQQSDFRFVFSKIPANRRYWAIESQNADMVMFEMPEWGWMEFTPLFEESKEIFHGGEVYITLNQNERDQSYFDDIKSKSIAAVFGYHYGFADYNCDRKWLEKNFSILLIDNPSHIIPIILRDRAEIGVVTESFLNRHFSQYPKSESELLVSKKKDQEYRLKALIGNHAPIKMAEFEALLDSLKKNGELKLFFDIKGVGQHLAY